MKYNNLNKLIETHDLILASGSPRRVKLLTEAGIPFKQLVPLIKENGGNYSEPFDMASELALKKAEAVKNNLRANQIALGCDTIVVIENEVLGKPSGQDEAFEMLLKLSGNCHIVCTAVSLVSVRQKPVTGYELTSVYFNDIAPDKIREYIDSGEPLDKAGSYGIQGVGGFLVDRIEGNLDNVIGLPMSLLNKLAGQVLKNEEHDGQLSY